MFWSKIKFIIGKLTKPKIAYTFGGSTYIPVDFTPLENHNFNYREIRQNRFGAWEKQTSWLGTSERIPEDGSLTKGVEG